MIDNVYEQSEIDFTIAQLAPDLQSKIKGAFTFPYEMVALKSQGDWNKHTEKGNLLWAIITPKGVAFRCGATKDAFTEGKTPSPARIYKCTDGTMIMVQIKAKYDEGAVNLPSRDVAAFGNSFVQGIFSKLNHKALTVPELSIIKENLGLAEVDLNFVDWEVSQKDYNAMVTEFKAIEGAALEDAYAGIITNLPEKYKEIVSNLEWLASINVTETYEFTDAGITSIFDYIKIVKNMQAITMLRIKSALGKALTEQENTYLANTTKPITTQIMSTPEGQIEAVKTEPVSIEQFISEQKPETPLANAAKAKVNSIMTPEIKTGTETAVMTPEVKIGDVDHAILQVNEINEKPEVQTVPLDVNAPVPEVVLTNVEQEKRVNVNQIVQEVEEANELGQPISEEAIQIPDVPIDEPVHPDIKEYIESDSAGILGTQVEGVVRLPKGSVEESKPAINIEGLQQLGATAKAYSIENPAQEVGTVTEVLEAIEDTPTIVKVESEPPQPMIMGRGQAFVPQVPIPGVNEFVPMPTVENLGQPAQVAQDWTEATLEPVSKEQLQEQAKQFDGAIPASAELMKGMQTVEIPSPVNIMQKVEATIEVDPEIQQVEVKSIESKPAIDLNSIPTELEASVEVGADAEIPEELVNNTHDVEDMPIEKVSPIIAVDKEAGTVTQVNSQSANLTGMGMPIKATMISVDPKTHKVEVKPMMLGANNVAQVVEDLADSQATQPPTAETIMESKPVLNTVPLATVANAPITSATQSPEQAAHNLNKHMQEVNQLADELEAYINLDAFKEGI